MAVSGAGLQWHRPWLAAERDRLLDFAEASRHPDGGFAWLDERGRPVLDRPVETWITCRMTHCFALAHLLGRPGAGELVDHGLAALDGLLHDDEHGGWYAGTGAGQRDKQAYAHAFVVLAASSATAAGRPGAVELLERALQVVETRFWRESESMVVDTWDRTWVELEDYRGANAAMHAVEAFLAAADVTGDEVWRDRALRMTERVVHGFARQHDWRLPEHFDAAWNPRLRYNIDRPGDPFRPYGVTIGHLLEWSRLSLHLRASLGESAPDWLLEDAVALFDRAVADGWAVDGADGFVYTTDWDGTPVVRERMHWVLAEAIGAATALHVARPEPAYEGWYRTWWEYAEAHVLDRTSGSWHHELDPLNRPNSTVWEGKPDVYHAVQATLNSLLPLAPSLATALSRPGHAVPAHGYAGA